MPNCHTVTMQQGKARCKSWPLGHARSEQSPLVNSAGWGQVFKKGAKALAASCSEGLARLCGLGSGWCLMLQHTVEEQFQSAARRELADCVFFLPTLCFPFHRCSLLQIGGKSWMRSGQYIIVHHGPEGAGNHSLNLSLSILLSQCWKCVLQQWCCALWKITTVPGKGESSGGEMWEGAVLG